MPYKIHASSANPRLLILLTDESEESVRIINRLIDQQIELNFDGEAPKNRCFISVISYNCSVKDLCSGWLKEFDANPLRYETLKKLTPDGAGGIVEIEVRLPVWIEPNDEPFLGEYYANAIRLIIELTKTWSVKHADSPVPMVLDCSYDSHVDNALSEIDQLKRISTPDGCVLFFGSYSNTDHINQSAFSHVPKEWFSLLRPVNIETNVAKTQIGIFDRNVVCSFIQALTDPFAEEPGFTGFV